jgi:hypothetical protein
MKRIAVLMALVLAVPLDALAQKPAEVSPDKPNMFTTKAACEEALESGNFRYYVPKFYGHNSRQPVDGVNRVVVPLESDTCLEMQVVGGRKFVVQKEGTMFRAHRNSDGSLSLYARDDCGNRVFDVVFPAPDLPVAEREPEPERPALYIPPPPPPREDDWVPSSPPPVVEKKGGKKWPWLVAGGLLLGGVGLSCATRHWPCPCPDGTKRQ